MTSDEAKDWLPAIDANELPEGKAVRIEMGGAYVLLVRPAAGSIFAVGTRCTHQGAPLDRGVLNLRDADPTVTADFILDRLTDIEARLAEAPLA